MPDITADQSPFLCSRDDGDRYIKIKRSPDNEYHGSVFGAAVPIQSIQGFYAVVDLAEENKHLTQDEANKLRKTCDEHLEHLDVLLSTRSGIPFAQELIDAHTDGVTGDELCVSLSFKTLECAIRQCEWMIVQAIVKCERTLCGVSIDRADSAELSRIADIIHSIDTQRQDFIQRWTVASNSP
jgi:hypothetical protein